MIQPTRGSFADYHPIKEDFPLIAWSGDKDYEVNDKALMEHQGYINDTLRSLVQDGLELEGEDDRSLLGRRGQWVLWWNRRQDGLLDRRAKMWWSCSSGRCIPKAMVLMDSNAQTKQTHDVFLLEEAPIPFDVSERRFRTVFADLIAEEAYESLRDLDYEGSWYAPRWDCMWDLWQDLRRKYDETAMSTG